MIDILHEDIGDESYDDEEFDEDELDDEEFDDEEDDLLSENEIEERLDALYSPGNYAEGESLCLEILEEIDPHWEPARLYLLLNLAAQDFEEEALMLVDDLHSDTLFLALRQLTFGAGTEAEELIYEDIIACAKSRGLEEELETYFATVEKPWARQDIQATLAAWD